MVHAFVLEDSGSFTVGAAKKFRHEAFGMEVILTQSGDAQRVVASPVLGNLGEVWIGRGEEQDGSNVLNI